MQSMQLGHEKADRDALVDDDCALRRNKGEVSLRWILLYFLIANIWTFVLTSIPVLTNTGPDNYYAHHPDWYTGDDVIRFIEPVGGLLINFFILYRSGIFKEVILILCIVFPHAYIYFKHISIA